MILSPHPGIPKHLGGVDYRLTQGHGENPAHYAQYGMLGHNGYDIAPFKAGELGHVLYAPHDCWVRVKNSGKIGYGLHVVLLGLPHPITGRQIEITLAHFADVQIGIDGKFIRAMDPIGLMGKSGDSTNVHCHITPRYILNGVVLDYNNGFKGAQQGMGQFFRIWINKSPLIITPQ